MANQVLLVGRLAKDPEIRYAQNEHQTCVARGTIAVNRKFAKKGEQTADFINIIAFGKVGEMFEKYLRKGSRVLLNGEWHVDSYKNKEGNMVYTNQMVVTSLEFLDTKATAPQSNVETPNIGGAEVKDAGFVNIPDDPDLLDELPFM